MQILELSSRHWDGETQSSDNLQMRTFSNSAPFNLEPQFDMATPRCSYEIRRSSVNGPLVRYALLGETVYHVWKCFGENFQMLVQNCYVEDGEGNHILIINNEGCGVDRYILKTPVYSTDRKTASQAMHVFKFAKKAITRFTCQIRICKQSDEVCYSSESSGQCEAIGEVELEAMERNKPEDGLERNKTEDGHSKVSWTGRPSTIHIVPAAATIKRFKNITTRRPDLTIPKNTMTTEATATETDEPFSTGISDDYGLYSNISPPSIKPAEEMIEVDPSTYQKRAKRKSFPNELAEREITLKSNEDYPAYDVSGVLTVLESPNDVVYFENKYLLAGDHHGTIDAISHPLARRMPQAIFSALLATIALSVLMMYILVRCITESRTRPTTWHEMAGHDSH
uniref:ZP domain-containing protein n=1 Tax=Setaria digitata TaxID=48799 RepID=A0A915PPR6_9BILA